MCYSPIYNPKYHTLAIPYSNTTRRDTHSLFILIYLNLINSKPLANVELITDFSNYKIPV